MKKILLSFAVLTASILTSCNKDANFVTPAAPNLGEDVSTISLTLTDEDSATRAASATAKTWEKSLSSLTVFAFDDEDELLLSREFLSTELSALKATFALPKSSAGTTCTFYAVANYDASSVGNLTQLLALIDSSTAAYNGTYSEVTTKAMRTGGFVMSGYLSKAVGAVNTTTEIGITLKRSIAKVEVATVIGSTFASKYPGATLTINSAKISKAASQGRVIAASTPSTGSMVYTHTQTPSSALGNLFYIFENGTLAVGSRVLLELNATFDRDGNTATTYDRFEVVYPIELSGQSAGNILRNGYYYIAATINGIVGQDCDVTITVADWESPVTQSVSLGS